MELTELQKALIYNELTVVDEYEYVPAVNKVLDVLGYDDFLNHDDCYDNVWWDKKSATLSRMADS